MNLIEKAAKHLEAQAEQNAVIAQAPAHFDFSKSEITPPAEIDHRMASATVELNFAKLAAAGFVTPNANGSLILDEFRVIKRPLLANARGESAAPIENANLIMVTSALPKDGKTFTALNLAMSIAMELDRTVLLVDADVARPSLAKLLDQPVHKGLLDLLENPALQLSDVLLHTNIPKLNLLMAGTPHPHATELLSSKAMNNLLEEMSNRYADRIIVFDSPPLLLTTEAQVLATHMGQIVFVVRAEETLQSAVTQALATIDSCEVKLMVLNQIREAGGSPYGYGYGTY